MAISDRVVIRADDLLNWFDGTINWSYGLRANTLLHPTIKNELNKNQDNNSHTVNSKDESDDNITSTNIRSLKNSKLDFIEVEKEKGKQKLFCSVLYISNIKCILMISKTNTVIGRIPLLAYYFF